MVLLALLATQVTQAGRAETRLASALRQGAQLRAAADAAVAETIWHMLDGQGDYWAPSTMTRMLNEPAGPVLVQVLDERGKFDVNQAPPAVLSALFSILGADHDAAQSVSNAIADWRTQQPAGMDADSPLMANYRMAGHIWGPPGQEFQRLEELKLVLGMTPALYEAALPYLTMGLEQGPWVQYASPVVLAAIARAKRDSGLVVDPADQRGPIILRIIASIHSKSGAAFTRRALLRLDGILSGPGWKYRILAWDDGAG